MHRTLIAISVVLVSLPLTAQDRAAIDGTVTDPSGALVGGATVELLSPDTGLRRQSSTNDSGIYEFPLTAVARRQGDNPQMTALMPMFEKYKVTAGFFGHDHNYQHYLKNGVHYFITGGGGAPLCDVDKPPAGITKMVESTEHFVVVKVEGKTVRVEALRLDGRPLETTELTANNAR